MGKGKEPGVGSSTWWEMARAGRPVGLFSQPCPCELKWARQWGTGDHGVRELKTQAWHSLTSLPKDLPNSYGVWAQAWCPHSGA